MNLALSTLVEANSEVVQKVISGETVLLLPSTGKVQVLNEVGGRIWELSATRCTLSEIAAVISAEYEVEPAQAEADVLAFIQELVNKQLVKVLS